MTTIPTPHEVPPPARRLKWWLRPVVWIAVVVVLFVFFIWRANHASALPNSNAGGGGRARFGFSANAPLPVVVRAAVAGDIDIYLNGLGTVTPIANVTLRTQISGQLMSVAFQEGQMVKQGDVLAEIDPRPYQVALQQAQGQLLQAQAQLKEAQIDLARYQTLSQLDSIAKQTVDSQSALVTQDEGLVQTDQAAIASAKLNLTYCHITAPVAGRVGLRQVDPGNYVTPGDSNGLVVLTQVKPITVIFSLPEDTVPDVAARLHSGAKIPVDAYDRGLTRKLASGALANIDNQVDPTTGTFKLRALFPNDDESLFPNQFVNVKMLLNIAKGSIVIPSSAVEQGQQASFVYVVKMDAAAAGGVATVSARTITLGPSEGEKVAVASGLAIGEQVVVDGADKLKDGAKVYLQKPAGPNPGKGSGAGHRHRPGVPASGAQGGGPQ